VTVLISVTGLIVGLHIRFWPRISEPAVAPEHARSLLKTHTNVIVGGAIAELLALCDWRRSDEASIG